MIPFIQKGIFLLGDLLMTEKENLTSKNSICVLIQNLVN